MKKILLVLALFSFYVASAQSMQHNDDTRVAGSFYYNFKDSKGVMEHVNINYTLYPAPFFTDVKMVLGTADPLPLYANIVNAAGVAVLRWRPENISYKYSKEFDISSLAPGKYHVDVYTTKTSNKLYSIPFEKMSDK
ncbi:MAG TPA: hypothetical protein VN721_16560 [Flavipsychrobacter sp.]|nr:hypothetical protein [Flavipsychrobacter sp.]